MTGALVASTTVISVVFELTDGAHVESFLAIPPDSIVTRLEIRANGAPVVALPFAIHDDSRRYHTICRRDSDEIEEMEL